MLARLVAVSSALALATIVRSAEPAGAPEFFENKIRPLLVEHCFKCHADKGKEPKGGLRLDSRAAMLKGGDNGTSIVPGEPDKSRLIEAVRYKNVDLQMPPKGKLPDSAIADLVAWVKAGAVWPNDTAAVSTSSASFDLEKRKREHWAWRAVQATGPPAVRDTSWPASPVDHFILAKLEEKGLRPATPAEGRVWIRRVTFDLIGLPPTPGEMDAFLADESPDARRKVVDRLLQSPHFGERWGRHWLDLMRYAETRGHEFDAVIPNAYQYRDYVIRAINADVPYDQFVREHIAGDLLAKPRRHPKEGFNESILGTGFWFLGEEVHSPVDIRQDQADRFDNRIDVLTKAFLGLTVSCARCHDHKFDAIGTKDYYALFGFLESSSYRLVRFDTLEHNQGVAARLGELNRQSAGELSKALARAAEPLSSRVADYLVAAGELVSSPQQAAAIANERKLDANVLARWIEAIKLAAKERDHPLHVWAKAIAEPKRIVELATPAGPAKFGDVVIDYSHSASHEWLPDEGAFGSGPVRPGTLGVAGSQARFAEYAAAQYDRVWDVLQAAPGAEQDRGALGKRPRAGRTIRTPNFRITSGKVHYLVRGAGTAYAAVSGHTLIEGPLHGSIVFDFAARDGFRWVTHDLTPYRGLPAHIEFTPAKDSDFAVAMVVQAEAPPSLPNRTFVPAGRPTSLPELAAAYQKAVGAAIARLKTGAPASVGDAQLANLLLEIYRDDKGVASTLAAFASSRSALVKEIRPTSRLALAIWDGTGVDEHVFVRGSPKAPGERVPRRFLEALTGKQTIGSPGSGRLELANEMTDPARNPFIARVLVNRVWHHLFGRGIVGSVDNFGVLGETPTHPELLDFLADRFVRDGWSLKRLIRELVLSSTYSMSAQRDPAAAPIDPQNLLLHHARIRRLEGEAIRDAMLAVSGRLNPATYGPPVPIHLTPFLDGRGKPSASGPLDGDGRRSIYLAVRRNFLNPMLLAFDTPIPFSTVGRRQISNVPAQALIVLNDPFVHQQSAVWAKSVLSGSATTEERIRGMYLSALGRPPSADELTACHEFLREQAARHRTAMDDVKPWNDLAHTLFNTKDFLYVD